MDPYKKLTDYFFYCKNFHKINTKLDGLQSLILRVYQEAFFRFLLEINGPKRVIVLKPRQCGLSTIVGSYMTHRMATESGFKCIAMADKHGRTMEIAGMYRTFIEHLPKGVKPHVLLNNTEQIVLDTQDKAGLGSSVRFETGQDRNAGRSGTRKGAHISEVAFIRHMTEIDEGLQNSIPLDPATAIIKESTANGRAGVGKPFFDLWQAAERGDSIYKPFFVAWYEIDDYFIQPEYGFKTTKYERELLKRFPSMNEGNINWRRLKLTEYLGDDENALLPPEERFNQDFPVDPETAFLSTGSPVFDSDSLRKLSNRLNNSRPADIKDRLNIDSFILKQFWEQLVIFTPPRSGNSYYIGADVSEGLALGDASSVCVIDKEYNQVAKWHGKIDPDLFGYLLAELGKLYNNALIVPEKNNMGISTVLELRNSNYPNIYKEVYEDKVSKDKKTRYGWVTTKVSKMRMLNSLVKRVRDASVNILDIRLVEEMGLVAREENGSVNLNGRDRVVAACLAVVGREQAVHIETVRKPSINKEIQDPHSFDISKPKKKSVDFFG